MVKEAVNTEKSGKIMQKESVATILLRRFLRTLVQDVSMMQNLMPTVLYFVQSICTEEVTT